MPLLWKVAHRNGYVTAADVVHGTCNSRRLKADMAARASDVRFRGQSGHAPRLAECLQMPLAV
jgi:hypothetical protein